jgi:hypothetical protein
MRHSILSCLFLGACASLSPKREGPSADPVFGTYALYFCEASCAREPLPEAPHGYVVLDSVAPVLSLTPEEHGTVAGMHSHAPADPTKVRELYVSMKQYAASAAQKGCLLIHPGGSRVLTGRMQNLLMWGREADGSVNLLLFHTVDAGYSAVLQRAAGGFVGVGSYTSMQVPEAPEGVRLRRLGPVRYATCLSGSHPAAPHR